MFTSRHADYHMISMLYQPFITFDCLFELILKVGFPSIHLNHQNVSSFIGMVWLVEYIITAFSCPLVEETLEQYSI